MKKSYHFHTMRVENICINAKSRKIRIKINKKKEILTLEIFIFDQPVFDRQISNLLVHLFQIRITILFGFWASFFHKKICVLRRDLDMIQLLNFLHSPTKNSNWIKNLICFRLRGCCRLSATQLFVLNSKVIEIGKFDRQPNVSSAEQKVHILKNTDISIHFGLFF